MVSPKDMEKARELLSAHTDFCCMIHNSYISELLGTEVYFKPELFQRTGSFKIRGAVNKILSMTEEERKKGLIAASSGNHALGVAYGAKLTGCKATIVMPTDASKRKIQGVRDLGAEIVFHGVSPKERYEKLYEIQSREGSIMIHSGADPMIVAGQGTIGVEIMEEMMPDRIIIPLGAGALAVGIACYCKSIKPDIEIIAVETEAVPRMTRSLEAGKAVDVDYQETLADGLKMVNTFNEIYDLVVKYVDRVVCVSEDGIRMAVKLMMERGKLLAEPSSCVPLAALMEKKIKTNPEDKNVLVVTGGNADIETLYACL